MILGDPYLDFEGKGVALGFSLEDALEGSTHMQKEIGNFVAQDHGGIFLSFAASN